MKCIITEPFNQKGVEMLKKSISVDIKYNICRDELLKCINIYDVLIVRSDTYVDKTLIDCGKELKIIGMAGIGLNHIDVEYATNKGIKIFNVPDGSNDSVAELTLALILCINRNVYNAIEAVKNNRWDKNGYCGNVLCGKTIGLVAMGKIGSKVANLCKAFKMNVLCYDPYIDLCVAENLGIKVVPLEDLLTKSDIISLHAPLTEQTYHMIGEKQFGIMKKDSYIVNLGRGGIIDEEALYNALVNGKIKGAAVDVMESEPANYSKLFGLDNFIATPHIGAGTIEAQEYISVSLATRIINHINTLEN